ncbi:MAG TPA: PIN domain-containing protein [Casimicrobiaceae bacterium]|nr:PIN domain-containing protein [Casimicrobiaceae bacterium]
MARSPESQVVHLDTHIVCWLYEGRPELLSAAARAAVEGGRLFVSPVVELELQLLYEIGRILKGPDPVLHALAREVGLQVTTTVYRSVATAACTLGWTRDPFDRLIVADAILAGAKLVTKERLIRKHCPTAVW